MFNSGSTLQSHHHYHKLFHGYETLQLGRKMITARSNLLRVLAIVLLVLVSVEGAPPLRPDSTKWIKISSNRTLPNVPVGSTFFVNCWTVNVTVIKNVRWIGPSGRILEGEMTDKIWVDHKYVFDSSVSQNVALINRLQFNGLEADHGGVYRCRADRGDSVLETSVEVKPFRNIEFDGCSSPQSFVAGRDLGRIGCRVSSEPPPAILWFRNGVTYEPDGKRCRIDPAVGIQCDPIAESDAGVYTCFATTHIPESAANRSIRVEVMTQPRIRNLKPELRVVEKDTVKLTCAANGTPPVSYVWLDADRQPYTNRSSDVIVNETSGALIIREVSRHEAGLLTCVATNNYGVQRRKVKLIVTSQQEMACPVDPVTSALMKLVNASSDTSIVFGEAEVELMKSAGGQVNVIFNFKMTRTDDGKKKKVN